MKFKFCTEERENSEGHSCYLLILENYIFCKVKGNILSCLAHSPVLFFAEKVLVLVSKESPRGITVRTCEFIPTPGN